MKHLKAAVLAALAIFAFTALLPGASACLAAQPEGMKKEKVLLDTDMVEMFDDGVAMIMLANAPNIDLVGITCVTGNSWVQEGVAYAARHLEIEGRSIPLHQGMQYPLRPQRHELFEGERAQFGMGHDSWLGSLGRREPESWQEFYRRRYGMEPKYKPADQHAVNFIIDTIRANPHEITIAAIGPLTNLACAIRMAPDIVPLVKRVVYMGGAFFQQGNVTPTAEFNWWIDPEAAQIVVRSAFAEQVVFGLDVCEKVVFRKGHYDRLMMTLDRSPEAGILEKTFVGTMFSKDPKFTHFVWDVIVAAYLIDPTIVTSQRLCSIDVNTQFGLSYGQSLAYLSHCPPGCQKAAVVMDIDQKKFWNMVCDPLYWASVRKAQQKP
ncbi:MAG: nucleoside hydrolase [Desulfovibrio sp.]|nr:nucleoside hydrolase [Desulfovibrio sp.]